MHWQGSGEDREKTESSSAEERVGEEAINCSGSCSRRRERSEKKGDKAEEEEKKKKDESNLALDAEKKEEEEEGPLAGGPHRCGARRGQSAAA